MSVLPNSQPTYTFGPFEFDPVAREVYKHGRRIHLQGQPLQILTALLAHPGEMVSREDLQKRLWPGAAVGDFEHGLNAAVNKLRIALGDAAGQPRYIETVSGRGYRFIAPVESRGGRPVLEMAGPVVLPERHAVRPQSPRLPWVGFAALIAVVAVAGYWAGSQRVPTPVAGPLQFEVDPPGGYFYEGAGNRQAFAISPDGTKLAFVAMNSSGLFRVFVRDLSALESHEVPESNGAGTVFWLPDGALMFMAQGKLRKLPAGAEVSQVIADPSPLVTGGTLLAPDQLLLASPRVTASMPPGGGPPKFLSRACNWPQLLPDGKSVLHVAMNLKTGRWLVRVGLLEDEGSMRDLFEADSRAVYTVSRASGLGYLLFVRNGALLAQGFNAALLKVVGSPFVLVPRVYSFRPTAAGDFAVPATGGPLVYLKPVERTELIWVDRQGQKLHPASSVPLATKDARLSPDGRTIASAVYDVERGVTDIWLTDVQSRAARREIAGPGNVTAPVWSPDSQKLVFMRAFTYTPRLFLRLLGGPGEPGEEALPPAEWQLPTDWSRDGRFVLYNNSGLPLVANEAHGDVWALDLKRRRSIVPLIRTPFHEANAMFSPDGRWIAFTSDDSGRPEVYLQRVQVGDTLQVTGRRFVVSQQGAICLRWRPDGKELFYMGGDGRIYSARVSLGMDAVIAKPEPLFSISTGAIAALHSLIGFDVSSDGNRFVIPSVTAAKAPALVVVSPWESLLPLVAR